MTVHFLALPDDMKDIKAASPFHYGALCERDLGNGQVLVLYPMAYTYRLCIGASDDHCGYDDGWCYPRDGLAVAFEALAKWDGKGDPFEGWVKQIATGRRRPDGTAASEYVAR